MTREEIRTMLSGGTLRSLGRANEVATYVSAQPQHFSSLFELLWDTDPVVRMKAADAAEKVTLSNRGVLQPHARELLGLLEEATQKELRWHLALMVPRLRLGVRDIRRAEKALREYLGDSSSIVKTCAMQGLAELVLQCAGIKPEILELFHELIRTGTPAMRARGKRLLPLLECEVRLRGSTE